MAQSNAHLDVVHWCYITLTGSGQISFQKYSHCLNPFKTGFKHFDLEPGFDGKSVNFVSKIWHIFSFMFSLPLNIHKLEMGFICPHSTNHWEKIYLQSALHKHWLLWFERVLLLSTASPPRYRGRCWAVIRLSHRPEPSGRVVRVGGRWIGQWRTTWSTVCSAPHSQAAEEAMPHLYKQERKRPSPVRKPLS